MLRSIRWGWCMLLNGLGMGPGPRYQSQSPRTGRSGRRIRNAEADHRHATSGSTEPASSHGYVTARNWTLTGRSSGLTEMHAATKIGISGLDKAVASLVFLVFLSACTATGDSSAGVDGEWRSETDQLGDTTVVRTISGSVWGDTMRLVPELAIGELEAPPEVLFGRITGLDVDPEGRILVVDQQAREVRLFSADGDHVMTIGGEGDGPGEFRNPDQARFTPDGGVVVRDQAGRFSRFAPDGSFHLGWSRGTGFGTLSPFFLTAEGEVLNPSLPDALVSYSLDGLPVDTVDVPTHGVEAEVLEVALEGGRSAFPIPFVPREHWTIDRQGRVLFGISDDYTVDRWDREQGVLRIERAAERAPVSAAEADQVREQMVRGIRSQTQSDWGWDGAEMPNEKPAFESLLAGRDGSIWVLREGVSREIANPEWDEARPEVGFPTLWQAEFVADVFDSEGAYLGPVKAPGSISWRFPHAVVSQEGVWAVAVHEEGHEQVVRFGLEPTRDD